MERAFSYHVITEPVNTPVTLAEVKVHLKLDPTDISQDTYLTFLIWSVSQYAEEYTKRIFINTKFKTYRDVFTDYIKLRRGKLQSVESYKYLVGGVLTVVPADSYYITDETGFSKIVRVADEEYPTDLDYQMQAIEIEFIAGYGTDSTDVPQKLKLAMLNHIAKIYENRGDCDADTSTSIIEQFLPQLSRGYYEMFRIRDYVGDCF